MNTILIILSAMGGIIALLLLLALLARKQYNIQRDVIINVPMPMVFDYLKHLKNQNNFNKWVMVEPTMKREYKGTDGTVGFIYAWNGTKAGEGEQEIKSITEGKSIETEIRFVRPMAGVAQANFTTEAISDDQVKVTWSNASAMKYPLNIMLPMIEKMLAKDMDTSLNRLKYIFER